MSKNPVKPLKSQSQIIAAIRDPKQSNLGSLGAALLKAAQR